MSKCDSTLSTLDTMLLWTQNLSEGCRAMMRLIKYAMRYFFIRKVNANGAEGK
jgi:hypothetical protein